MRLLTLVSTLAAVVPSVRFAHASPLQVRQDANPTSCGPIISAIASYGDPTPFCSSWLGITTDYGRTVTEYTTRTIELNRTVTSITGTNVITAPSVASLVNITASTSVVTQIVATSTLTFCDARAAKVKRNPVPQATSTTKEPIPTFIPLPYYIQPYPTPDISSACSCLQIPTPAVTVVATRTALGDHVFVTGIATNVTTTPYYNITVTSTPVSTTQVTLYATYIGAPDETIPPTYLPSPTLISNDGDADDDPFTIAGLPFEVTFFNVGTSEISVSPNGWIGITSESSTDFNNGPLPTWNSNTTTSSYSLLPDTAVLPLWDDLLIVDGSIPNPESGLSQRIVYETQGYAPSRTLTIEWVASKFGDPLQHYRFWVVFFEDRPNAVRFIYWDVSDAGVSATVGAQGETANLWSQYALGGAGAPAIWPGLVLDYDIAGNKFVPGSLYEGLC